MPLSGESPFDLHMDPKVQLTNEDYVELQQRLRAVNIRPLLEEMYVPDVGMTTLEDLEDRCTRGLTQILIDPEKGWLPSVSFVQIGKGGDACFVTCVPFNRNYPAYIPFIAEQLGKVGFNGYLLARMGGFPNPSGREALYAGVPYSFKIFMMLEAYHRGFTRVIWIDSAVIPLRNPEPLFAWLDHHSALIRGWPSPPNLWKYIFPRTRELLQSLTDVDVLKTTYINTIVFGLKINDPLVERLIAKYEQMVEMGWPFLSCFPEEFVLTAILNQWPYSSWQPAPFRFLVGPAGNLAAEAAALPYYHKYKMAYFYHRLH